MDVKSNVLPKSLQGPPPAPKPQSKRDTDDEKKLSTDVSQTSPSSPPLSDDIRKALIGELLNRSTEVNRFYQGTLTGWTSADVTAFAGGAVTLSAIPQGTGAGQRLGDSVRFRRLRLRFHVRPGQVVDPGASFPGPTAGQPADIEYSYSFRIIVGLDKMPVIGTPVYWDTGSVNIGGTFPFSYAATHANPRATLTGTPAANPGQILLAVRNPQTLSRYHILYDRIHNGKADDYPSATILDSSGSASAIGYYRASSNYIDLEFDLHGHISQWYDQANDNAIFTNKLFFILVGDSTPAGPVKYKWISEVEFENYP